MKGQRSTPVGRRDLLRVMVTGAAAAAATKAGATEPAETKPESRADKRKARYQPNSKEVQNFYRVNSYPTR